MARVLKNLFRRFDAALRQSANASARSMVVAAAVGAIIFTGYGILWLYVAPVEYESLGLRSVAVLLCLAVSLSPYWPQRWKQRFLPWAWFAAVMYALPFYATYQLLGSNYSVLRSMLEVTMVFFVVVIFPHYLLALATILLGTGLGVLAGYLTIPNFATLNHAIVKSVHLQAMVYSATAGLLFTRSNLEGILVRQRIHALKDLAGSIAHELRNPLGQLRYRLDSIGRSLPGPSTDGKDPTMPARQLDAVYKELAEGKLAIERGMQMISMTLDEIHAKPLDTSQLRYLSAAKVTRKAVDEFGYENAAHRERVELRVAEDFVFKGDETRYLFVLFNLLKNALHYFDAHPAALVTITVGSHGVRFEDTGPGMRPEVLARAFESFHTAGKVGGTGLGLSFCKRTMLAFGGDIACTSELGRFTRFVLRFPAVDRAEIAAHEAQVVEGARAMFAGRRILVVDDLPALRLTARAMLKPLGAQIEEAENGQEALDLLARQPFDAMVLDLSMPVLDGYATAGSIRAGRVPGRERLPIVAYSAESPVVALAKLQRVGVDVLVDKACSRVELLEALCRVYRQAGHATDARLAAESLAGRTILLADDQAFNRRFLRSLLEQHGVRVLEAPDGASALATLQASAVDAIITDIHMPVLDGIGLARAVQESSRADKPVVIALSARDDAAAHAKARAAGIRDFLTKPAEADKLIETLARHLLPRAGAASSADGTLADLAAGGLLDAGRLRELHRVDVPAAAVLGAMQAIRASLGKLQEAVAAREADAARELLHALVGTCGDVGAQALHQRVRSLQPLLEQAPPAPQAGWYEELVRLHARTEQALRDAYPQGSVA